MRYLRSINEMIYDEGKLEEIQEFCNTNLAYLIDNGFGIRVRNGSNNSRARIELYNGKHYDSDQFSWDEVKDHFIPFFTRLCNKYPISTLEDRIQIDDKYQVRTCYAKISYAAYDYIRMWERSSKWVTKAEISEDLLSQFNEPYVNKMFSIEIFIG